MYTLGCKSIWIPETAAIYIDTCVLECPRDVLMCDAVCFILFSLSGYKQSAYHGV